MDSLPAEMIEEIVSYLNLEDVIACSKVNEQWEKSFNFNSVWDRFLTSDRKYFEKNVSKMSFSLESAKCLMEPCQSKILALKELFTKQNIDSGKYHTEELKLGKSYVECIKETLDETGNHWLFVSLWDRHAFRSNLTIQVWSLNLEPELRSQTVSTVGMMQRGLNSKIKVTNNKCMYVGEGLVLIYLFDKPHYELKFICKLEPCNSIPSETFLCSRMICFSSTIVCFTITNFHLQQHLHPSYQVWNFNGISVSDNLEEFNVLQTAGDTWFPRLCVRKKGQKVFIIGIFKSLFYRNQERFLLKEFDSKEIKYTDIVVERHGLFDNFELLGNVVVLIYTIRSPGGYNPQKYIESVNLGDGSSLFLTRLESAIQRAIRNETYMFKNNDLIVIGNKIVSIFNVTKTGLNHFSHIQHNKKVCLVRVVQDHFIVIQDSSEEIYYDFFSYKTGEKIYRIKLLAEALLFSCKKTSVPTNIIAYRDPDVFYAHLECKEDENLIFIMNFW